MAIRESVLTKRLGATDPAMVRQEIERHDAAHTETIRATFDVDWASPLLYHVVLNSGRFSVDDCVKIIYDLARDHRFQDVLAIQTAIADKLLALRVGSTLVEQIGSEVAGFAVSAVSGKITLDGITSRGGLPAKAERVAREVAGVHEVESHIESAPSHGREFSYPRHPVRMIGAFAVGGVFDISARLVGQWLTAHMGKPFVTENRLGQRGYPTTETFARVPTDLADLLAEQVQLMFFILPGLTEYIKAGKLRPLAVSPGEAPI
jgi:hypothetical protein